MHGKICSRFLFSVLMTVSTLLIAQPSDSVVREIEIHRKKQQEKLLDPKESPLDKKRRKNFDGLDYYPINLNYRVTATFVKTESPSLFKMKTTTARLPEYLKFGELHFNLDGEDRVLEVYQSLDISQKSGFEDYLFIPFTDETNGIDTYDVGRYIDFKIPSSKQIVLDFNQSYNPYCSYGSAYSCPIPPAANHLPIKITAGEKKYFDNK